MQIIFFFWSFEISEGILGNQKIIIGLDSFAYQRFDTCIFGPNWILQVFLSTTRSKDINVQKFSLAPCCQIYRVIEEG